jgi:membrane protein CcdC involved in cytochrome C biogenesis
MQAHEAQGWISYAITAVIIGIVFAVRWRRMSMVKPLKLERLWIFPALYAAVALYMVVMYPPQGLAWLFCALALIMGAALGWQRGKMMRITINPDSHALNTTSSPAAVLFLVAIVAVRTGARAVIGDGQALHLNAFAITDMLVALALGLFTTQRIEMYLRAKRLLDTARARQS